MGIPFRRRRRSLTAPWGLVYPRFWERVDNLPFDCVVGVDGRGIYVELVHRYTGHPSASWWEPLSIARWTPAHEVFAVAKSKLQEVLARARSNGVGQAAVDKEMEEEFPILFALMTSLTVDGKAKRQPSSVTIFTQDGMWKACVVEKDADMSLFGSADSLWGALANLEARLDAPIVDWRERARPAKKK